MWNKKGEGNEIWIMITIVLALIVLIVLAVIFFRKMSEGSTNIDAYGQCSVFNKKGGCVSEADKLTKEDSGDLCFNNTGGCKGDKSWCCYAVG
jgi:hypothetical protein